MSRTANARIEPLETEVKPAPLPAAKSRPIFHVEDLIAHLRRITTTDDGKLQIVLEGEGLDDPTIAKVKDLLPLQQDPVLVSIRPAQGDLFGPQ